MQDQDKIQEDIDEIPEFKLQEELEEEAMDEDSILENISSENATSMDLRISNPHRTPYFGMDPKLLSQKLSLGLPFSDLSNSSASESVSLMSDDE